MRQRGVDVRQCAGKRHGRVTGPVTDGERQARGLCQGERALTDRHRDLELPAARVTSATVIPVIDKAYPRSTVLAPGNVSWGGLLTAPTLIAIDLLSVFAPPEPVLPWSSTLMVSVVGPVVVRGSQVIDRAKAAFTLATVPVKVMAASLVPSPTVNVRPVVCAR